MAVNSVRDRDPSLLAAFGADLGDALEQQLFFALRDGRSAATGAAGAWVEARSAMRTALAVAGATLPRAPRLQSGAVVVLVREPIHLAALRSVERELTERDGPHLVALLVGRAAAVGWEDGPRSVRLERLLHPALGSELLRLNGRGLRRLRPATERWDGLLGPRDAERLRLVAGEEVPRIGLAAFALASAIRRLEPSLIGAFDEVGTWARILPTLARAHGTPSLDIPHAEAADAEAIRGAGYDRMAVYGPHAAAVLRAAGISDERIVQVGAPRFDAIARSYPASPAPVTPPRVVFAAQYVAGALTADALRISFAGALAAAARLAPSELVVRPHPAEPPGTIAGMVAELSPQEGVTVRIDASRSLHELLDGAWLMVTAWSNSVLEAAVMGVPSLAVVPADVADPVNFAAEGLALHAASAEEAADVAEHLRDVGERTLAVERARAALAAHIGPPDGLASSRVADLMISMATRGDHDAA
jgi:hypothetical protein